MWDWLRQMRPLIHVHFLGELSSSRARRKRFGYHAVNVLLHWLNAIFIFLAVRKVLSWTSMEESRLRILSIFAAGLFLLHPLQTESVSYAVTQPFEKRSACFILAALVVFLYRRGATLPSP